MPQEKIIIKFEPSGDKRLVSAINALRDAQMSLEKKTSKVKQSFTTLNPKMLQVSTNLKQQGKDWTSLGISIRVGTQALRGNKNAIALVNRQLTKLNKTSLLGVRNNRLMANSFATLRSKLLLFSFAMSMGGRQIMKFAAQAAKAESMERAFTTLAGGAGDASIAMDKLREATDGTMSKFDLFQQANNAMILGVTKNSDEMAEMFDIAQRLGRALGVDTKLSVESLIVGIGRQSRMMLDNIGIVTDVDKANRAYASSLGKTTEQLTDTERRQAFLNATMEAAREKLATMPDEIKSTQDAYDGLSASATDAAIALGEVFAELFKLPEVAEQTGSMLGFFARNIDIIGLAARTALTPFFGLPAELNIFKKEVEDSSDVFENFPKQLENLSEIFPALAEEDIPFYLNPDTTQGLSDQVLEILDEMNEKLIVKGQAQADIVMGQLGGVTSAWKSNLDARLNSELNTLKQSEKYQRADAEGRKKMEKKKRAEFAKEQVLLFRTNQAMSLADVYFNTASAVMKSVAISPLTGGQPWAAISIALGSIQAALILAQKPPQAATGGLIGGRRHSAGGTIIEAEQGEFIMSRDAVDSVGLENLNLMNEGGGGQNITLNISAPLVDDTVVDSIIPAIREAIRRGEDIGIS